MDYNTQQHVKSLHYGCFSPTKFRVQWIKCIISVWNCSANTTPWLSAGMPHHPHHMQSLPPHTAWVWTCNINIVSTLETSAVVLHPCKVYCVAAMYAEVNICLPITSSATLKNISVPFGIQISASMKMISIHLTLFLLKGFQLVHTKNK